MKSTWKNRAHHSGDQGRNKRPRPTATAGATAQEMVGLPLPEGPITGRGGNHRRRRPRAIHQAHLHTVRGIQRHHHPKILRPAPKMVRDFERRQVENEEVLLRPLDRYPQRPRINVCCAA